MAVLINDTAPDDEDWGAASLLMQVRPRRGKRHHGEMQPRLMERATWGRSVPQLLADARFLAWGSKSGEQ